VKIYGTYGRNSKLNNEMILKIWNISVLVMGRFGKYNRKVKRIGI
jgi:hypothetical protein